MEFMKLAKARHSVRKYQDRPVEEEKLQRILEAGRVCPTAANKQPQRFLTVSSAEGLQKLGSAAKLHGAPLAVIVCCEKARAWVRPYDGWNATDTDASIALTHMMLEAWEQGLGSCWIDMFDPAAVTRDFELPDGVVPVHIMVFGYAEGEPESPDRHTVKRIPLDEMVWREKVRQM